MEPSSITEVLGFSEPSLIAVALDPKLPVVCKPDDKGPDHPVYHFGERWRISTDYEGAVVLQEDQTIRNSGIVRRSASLPFMPTRKNLVVHWRLESTDAARAVCSDLTTTLEFCFWPDGDLTDVQSCP
jgi:hypothetical protein